jgi:hypothetical protein
MRNAARRKEKAHYTLTIGVTGKAVADLGTPLASDTKVKGTLHHATGNIAAIPGPSRSTTMSTVGFPRR